MVYRGKWSKKVLKIRDMHVSGQVKVAAPKLLFFEVTQRSESESPVHWGGAQDSCKLASELQDRVAPVGKVARKENHRGHC